MNTPQNPPVPTANANASSSQSSWRSSPWFYIGLAMFACLFVFGISAAGFVGYGMYQNYVASLPAATETPAEQTVREAVDLAHPARDLGNVDLSGFREENSQSNVTNDGWDIQYFDGATDEMHKWELLALDPAGWPVFPNVDNGKYPASQGVEYGEDLSAFCQQDTRCDFNVAARHYRLYTGDYSLKGVGECHEKESGQGCLLLVVNVGDVTAMFRDQKFDYGFTVTGRYFDGDYLSQAMWALMSNGSANMLNMETDLNPGGTNGGANCSVPGGCDSVEATFVVTSGNEILMIGQSVVSK